MVHWICSFEFSSFFLKKYLFIYLLFLYFIHFYLIFIFCWLRDMFIPSIFKLRYWWCSYCSKHIMLYYVLFVLRILCSIMWIGSKNILNLLLKLQDILLLLAMCICVLGLKLSKEKIEWMEKIQCLLKFIKMELKSI